VVRQYVGMDSSPFAFQVQDVIAPVRSCKDWALIGPRIEGDISVGDRVSVPTTEGIVEAVCTGFPLIRLGPDRQDWIQLLVAGVDGVTVILGSTVHSVSEGPG
jgi:hypothetical protein